MKLNVGCGEFYVPGWFNIDIASNDLVHPDLVVVSGQPLPEEIKDVKAVYCGHVLEHLPYDDVVPYLVSIRERMTPDAPIVCVGPDVFRAEEMWAAGEIDEATYRSAGSGANRWDGDRHYWDCHEQELIDLLAAAGFRGIAPINVTWAHRAQIYPLTSGTLWQCAVGAHA